MGTKRNRRRRRKGGSVSDGRNCHCVLGRLYLYTVKSYRGLTSSEHANATLCRDSNLAYLSSVDMDGTEPQFGGKSTGPNLQPMQIGG